MSEWGHGGMRREATQCCVAGSRQTWCASRARQDARTLLADPVDAGEHQRPMHRHRAQRSIRAREDLVTTQTSSQTSSQRPRNAEARTGRAS